MKLAWNTGTPPHSKPGTRADYFLCIPIESNVPVVLVYIHDEKQWTKGGGDTQRIRWWSVIPPMPNDRAEPQPKKP